MIIIPDSTQIEANTRSTHGRGTGRTLTLVILHVIEKIMLLVNRLGLRVTEHII